MPEFADLEQSVASRMNFTWILLASIGWALGLAFALGLIRMFGDQGRAARHQSKGLDRYSDVTITRTGNG